MRIDCLLQSYSGQILDDGIHADRHHHLLWDRQRALLGIVALEEGITSEAAQIALQILQDDMATNLVSADSTSHAVGCLDESMNNIHEYLAQTYPDVFAAQMDRLALCSLLVYADQCFYQPAEGLSGFLFSSGSLSAMTAAQNGAGPDVYPLQSVQQIILIEEAALQLITPDYLRLTLTRFPDNPEFALRQITSKTQQKGFAGRPLVCLCSIHIEAPAKRRWFSRS